MRNAAREPIDWDRLLRIAERHRIVGLVYRAICEAPLCVPSSVAAEFAKRASAQAIQTMQFAFESGRLQKLMEAAGLEVLFLKGVTVAMLAYGELGLRQAKDIDIFIAPDNVVRASAVLEEAGYLPSSPVADLPTERSNSTCPAAKGTEWRNRTTGIEVEMHWYLTDMRTLLPDALVKDTRQRVAVAPGIRLTTLDRDHLFAFLCLHGAAHAWSRLKWLADIYALLPRNDHKELERLYRAANDIGAGRAPGQALLLCAEVFGLSLGARLQAELTASWPLIVLRYAAMRMMLRGGAETEIYDLRFGTTEVYLSRFLVGRGWRFLALEARQRAFPPDLVIASELPHHAAFLYPIIRLVHWLRSRVAHRGRSTRRA